MISQRKPPGGKDPKQERVQEISAAALAEFYEQGFAAARLDSIAERAGVAKGTIYLYFSTKEELFEEAARNVILPIIEQIESLTNHPGGSAKDVLTGMITMFYREVVATDRRRLIRLLISEGPRFPSLLTFYHAEIISRGIAAIRNVVELGVARGEFRASAATRYPQVVFGPALMGAIWKLLFDEIEPLDLDGLRDAHLDIILHGLLATPATGG